jgi:hypothetical protein
MSQTYLPNDDAALEDYIAQHSGDGPHHEHHHHHHKHERHHNHHQGDSPYTINQHHSHDTIRIGDAAPQDPLQGCLQLLRGIGSVDKCERVLGHVVAALAHSGHIRGLVRAIELAATHMNHYTGEIARRDY